MGLPARGTQYPQPPGSQVQYPPMQQYVPQDIQLGSGRDTHEGDEEDPAEERDKDESYTELLSFEGDTSRVEYILHAQYADLRDSRQVQVTREAADDIVEAIESITDQVQLNSHFVTKHRAMCALFNIGMLVAEADGFLGNKVRNHLAYDTVFVEAFQSVYDNMTGTEREKIGLDYLEDLERLVRNRDLCFEGLDGILKQFRAACSPSQGKEGTMDNGIASVDLTA